ncbi:MAG: riboflavin synthase [Candidatus Acidiferrales bacterium]
MFTGIVEHVGTIESLDCSPQGGRIHVNFSGAPEIAASIKIADSIAVNGCCLTVVAVENGIFAADLSVETLQRTSLGEMKPGQPVNLERPLAANSRLGGHFVQGHVDGIGRVARLEPEGENWWLSVRVPDEMGHYVAMKGSIAIDGISLTVAGWREGVVDVALIPFTYAHTNIRGMIPGAAVNLECDILAKYVERMLQARREPAPARLTVANLIEEGF